MGPIIAVEGHHNVVQLLRNKLIILVGMGIFSTPHFAVFAINVSAKLKPRLKHVNHLQYLSHQCLSGLLSS
jgi:hypothetical protein